MSSVLRTRWGDLPASATLAATDELLIRAASDQRARRITKQMLVDALNVQNFGASGNGIDDDSAPIQDAINASAPGQVVWFPRAPVAYGLGNMLDLAPGRSYLGTGRSLLKQLAGANLPALGASHEWIANTTNTIGDPIRVSGLIFDADKLNNAGTTGLIIQSANSVVDHCTIRYCDGDGVMFTSLTRNGSVVNWSLVENWCDHLLIYSPGRYGIYFHDTAGKLTDGYIDGCIVEGPEDTAIYLERAAGMFVTDNHVYGCQTNGIVADRCWASFFTNNEVDGFGESLTNVGYWSGITLSLIGPRPTLAMGNLVAAGEVAGGTHYQYFVVNGAGTTDTHATVVGNSIAGGWDGNPNYGGNPAYSQGFIFVSNGTQQGSGQPCEIDALANRANNVGKELYADAYTTLLPVRGFGGLSVDLDLQIGRHIVSGGTTPGVAAGAANGTTPPTPTVSGNDITGYISVGSGGSPTAGAQVVITFATPYAYAPTIVISANNPATAALGIYVSAYNANGFTVAATNAPADSQPVGTYIITYVVIG